MFASLEVHNNSQMSSSADTAIPREAPMREWPTPKRSCHREEKPQESQSQPEEDSEQEKSREVVDFESKQHGPSFQALTKEEQNWLLKIHRNLGHPGAAKLTEYCRQLGCPSHILAGVGHLRCSTCLETSRPTIPRPGAIHEPEDFGDTISMDGGNMDKSARSAISLLPFCVSQYRLPDSSVFTLKTQETTEMAIRAVMQGWINWAGPPSLLCVDAATELNSEEFLLFSQKHKHMCPHNSRQMHIGRNSRAERHWRYPTRNPKEDGPRRKYQHQ